MKPQSIVLLLSQFDHTEQGDALFVNASFPIMMLYFESNVLFIFGVSDKLENVGSLCIWRYSHTNILFYGMLSRDYLTITCTMRALQLSSSCVEKH